MKWHYVFALLIAAAGTSAQAQSVAELRAQAQQVRQQIAEAEAAGVDPAFLQSLRDMMDETERTISEMEADQASAAAAPEPAPVPVAASYAARPNALDGDPACAEFTIANYRELGLRGGDNVQLDTMCAAAFEYYSAYLNAIRQGYAEADANRTYEAHSRAALVASTFYRDTRAD